MELFDVVKTIFKSEKEWAKVGRNDKIRNFFMLNRIMSIQFPIQADQFNNIKISPKPVIDWWHSTLSRHYSRQPGWIFTKTKKKENKKPDPSDFVIDPEIKTFILNRFEMSKRELKELEHFFPEQFKKWATSITEQIKSI